MYFYYGITHSTLENPSEEIELTVDQTTYVTPPAQGATEQTAVWDRHGYENRMATEEDSGWSNSNSYWGGNQSSWGDHNQNSSLTVNSNKTYSINSTNENVKKPPNTSSDNKSQSKSKAKPAAPASAASSKSRPPPPAAPSATSSSNSAPKKDGFGLFIEETQFPTWDE